MSDNNQQQQQQQQQKGGGNQQKPTPNGISIMENFSTAVAPAQLGEKIMQTVANGIGYVAATVVASLAMHSIRKVVAKFSGKQQPEFFVEAPANRIRSQQPSLPGAPATSEVSVPTGNPMTDFWNAFNSADTDTQQKMMASMAKRSGRESTAPVIEQAPVAPHVVEAAVVMDIPNPSIVEKEEQLKKLQQIPKQNKPQQGKQQQPKG